MQQYSIFIPHLTIPDASVEKIIEWMHIYNIGLVEHVNLVGKYGVYGECYYEALVYFEYMYDTPLAEKVKKISCIGGSHRLEHKPNHFIEIKKQPIGNIEDKLKQIEQRLKKVELAQVNMCVTDDTLLTIKRNNHFKQKIYKSYRHLD